MPYQVSWQSVEMKSQAPVHVLGADVDAVADVLTGAALLAAGSAAHAPLAAPRAARIVAENMPNLVVAVERPSSRVVGVERDSDTTHRHDQNGVANRALDRPAIDRDHLERMAMQMHRMRHH